MDAIQCRFLTAYQCRAFRHMLPISWRHQTLLGSGHSMMSPVVVSLQRAVSLGAGQTISGRYISFQKMTRVRCLLSWAIFAMKYAALEHSILKCPSGMLDDGIIQRTDVRQSPSGIFSHLPSLQMQVISVCALQTRPRLVYSISGPVSFLLSCQEGHFLRL